MFDRTLVLSRRLMIAAVIGVLLAATALLTGGAVTTLDLMGDTALQAQPVVGWQQSHVRQGPTEGCDHA